MRLRARPAYVEAILEWFKWDITWTDLMRSEGEKVQAQVRDMVIEMRDRVGQLFAAGAGEMAQVPGVAAGAQAEAFSALVTLGYKPAEVSRLLKAVSEKGQSTEDIIRKALRAAVKE